MDEPSGLIAQLEQLTAEKAELQKRIEAWEKVGRLAVEAIPTELARDLNAAETGVPDWFNGGPYEYGISDLFAVGLEARGLLKLNTGTIARS